MIEGMFILVFGTIIGSFLNAVIWRTYASQSIAHGRSKCVHCEHELSAGDLIPIISFLLLKGTCRYCKKKISWQYPLVELATALLFFLAYLSFLHSAPDGIVASLATQTHIHDLLLLARNWIFLSILTVLFVTDLRWYELPDSITLPALVFSFAFNMILSPTGNSVLILLEGAFFGAGFFAIQYILSRGAWIGGGDIRLGGLMGVMLGFLPTAYALFIAYMVGACIALFFLAMKKRGLKSQIQFGPFLAGATAIMLLYGTQIQHFFTRFYF